MMKIIATIISLFFLAPGTANAKWREVKSFKAEVKALITKITGGKNMPSADEMEAIYAESLEGEKPICGPEDPIDENGHCEEYYRVKAEIEELVDELIVEDDSAVEPGFACNTSGMTGSTGRASGAILFLCLITLGTLALKRKRRGIC